MKDWSLIGPQPHLEALSIGLLDANGFEFQFGQTVTRHA